MEQSQRRERPEVFAGSWQLLPAERSGRRFAQRKRNWRGRRTRHSPAKPSLERSEDGGQSLNVIRPCHPSCPTLLLTGALALILARRDCFADIRQSQMTTCEPQSSNRSLFSRGTWCAYREALRTRRVMGVVVCGGWMGYVATPSTPHTEATQPKQQSKCGTLGALGSSATAGSIGIQSAPVFAAFPHSCHAIASSPLGSCGSRAGYATEYIPWNKETPSCASHGLLISRLGLMARRIRILRQWDIDACPASLILASTLMVLQEMYALLTPVNMLSTLERWFNNNVFYYRDHAASVQGWILSRSTLVLQLLKYLVHT